MLKWFVILFLLLGLIVGAFLLYGRLAENYGADNLLDVNFPESGSEEEKENGENSSPTDEKKNTAPNFKVTDINGNEVSLSDYFGRPIVVNFWATWCGYCKQEMPHFDRAAKEYPNVLFMMVSVDESVSDARSYIEKGGFDFPIFFDPDHSAADAYGVHGYPTTYFIDKDGNAVTHARGMISYETLVRALGRITE